MITEKTGTRRQKTTARPTPRRRSRTTRKATAAAPLLTRFAQEGILSLFVSAGTSIIGEQQRGLVFEQSLTTCLPGIAKEARRAIVPRKVWNKKVVREELFKEISKLVVICFET